MKEEFVKLSSLAEFINGAAFKPEDWGTSGKRIIRIQNLTNPQKPFNHTERLVSERVHVHPGDILVSWSASLGIFEWNEPDIALLNQHIFRVIPNKEKVDKRYLRHGLEIALLDMQRHLHGATMQHVNRGEFLSTKLYCPPIADQKRIAAILDKAEELRELRRQALRELDAIAQSIFIEMFGDPATNPMGWKFQQLRTLVNDNDTINYGVVQPGNDTEDGIPLVRVGDLIDGQVNHTSLKKNAASIESSYQRSRP
jgi:type I restriction enzyme S subunit